ncbi:TVP38/TMEM64 family protein, partial [Streptococcus suis]
MYKFFQKVIQVLSVLVLIGTAIFLFWLYKIGILNDQNALSNLLQNQ